MQTLQNPGGNEDDTADGGIILNVILSSEDKQGSNTVESKCVPNNTDNNVCSKEAEQTCEDFDEILEMIGSEGKFQKILLYAVLCPIVTVSPFLILNTLFMWDVPDHFCAVPGRDAGVALEEWKNLTLPWERGPDGLMRHSQCKMIDPTTGNETACQFGWEYDKTDYETTIPSEFNWVCDKDQYATDCFTLDSVGNAVGTLIFGIMGDKYGRKPVFFLALSTNLLFKTASLFYPHNHTIYKTLQLLGGFAFPAVYTMPALICAEMSGATYRSWIYAVTWMIWVFGNSILPFVAKICRGWFLFGCVASIPGFFLLLYYPFIEESPRWLITAGKADSAVAICLKMAKTNGKEVDAGEIERKVEQLVRRIKKDAEGKNFGLWTLFSKYRIAKNTIVLTIAGATNTLLYYGITLNTTHMAGDKFLNYFLLSIIELPAGWIAGELVEKTGRRWTQVAFFCLCTVSCLICAVAVTYPGQAGLVIMGALGIKFAVTITSLVAYLQVTEIFPTQLRSTGSGFTCTVGSTIQVFGPYIVYSEKIHVSFPYALLCLCSFLGLLSAAFLPETLKQHLPETIEDANKFGKGHKFWSYLPEAQQKAESKQI